MPQRIKILCVVTGSWHDKLTDGFCRQVFSSSTSFSVYSSSVYLDLHFFICLPKHWHILSLHSWSSLFWILFTQPFSTSFYLSKEHVTFSSLHCLWNWACTVCPPSHLVQIFFFHLHRSSLLGHLWPLSALRLSAISNGFFFYPFQYPHPSTVSSPL